MTMTLANIKYLIVEDEEMEAIRLKFEVEEWEKNVRGTKTAIHIDIADSPSKALLLYAKHQHDVLFLDIGLAGNSKNGYDDVLGEIKKNGLKLPYTVITTGAVDRSDDYINNQPSYNPYIIGLWKKPFFDEVEELLTELFLKIQNLENILSKMEEKQNTMIGEDAAFLVINKQRVFLEKIIYLKADGACTRFFVIDMKGSPHHQVTQIIATKNIGHFEKLLPNDMEAPTFGFLRTHESYIVNKAHVSKYKNANSGGILYFKNCNGNSVQAIISKRLFSTVIKELFPSY